MATVYAAMIELDNRDTFQGLNNASYDAFDNALGQAKALFDAHAAAGDVKLFLGPEYLFSGHDVNARGGVNINSLTSKQKLDIYKKVERSSARYNDIVVVAGSIAYAKWGLFSGWSHLAVCPVALDGSIILKYYKRTWDQFQAGSSADTFDTKNKGYTFVHKGLTFGIEICSDYGAKTLKTALAAAGQTIDVHLLVSEGMTPSAMGAAVGVGKLLVNCDMSGRGGGNGVRQVTRINAAGQSVTDAGATGRVTEVRATQPLGSGAHVVLYRGTVT